MDPTEVRVALDTAVKALQDSSAEASTGCSRKELDDQIDILRTLLASAIG